MQALSQVMSNGISIASDPDRLGPMRDSTGLLGDPAALHAELNQHGYVYLRGVLPRERVMKLREQYFATFDPGYLQPGTRAADGIWSGHVPPGLPAHGVAGHPAYTLVRSPEFAEFAESPELAALARSLLGEDEVLQLPRQIVRHFHRGPASSRAHTDHAYMDRGSESIVTMWLPIGDCPVTSGGLTYLEGSHRLGPEQVALLKSRRTDRPDDLRPISHDLDWTAQQLGGRWLYANFAAGDVAVHTPHLVHASLDTATEQMRMSVDLRFLPKQVQPDPRWLTKWSGDDGN